MIELVAYITHLITTTKIEIQGYNIEFHIDILQYTKLSKEKSRKNLLHEDMVVVYFHESQAPIQNVRVYDCCIVNRCS
jgi:hypothetical protein